VPVYRRPSNLIPLGRRTATGSFPNKGQVGRKLGRKKIVPYYDRAEIEEGVLNGRGLEICWLKDPIDLLFIQIQGSARIRMPDGSITRINYDAHNGYPYTAVGRPLIEMKAIPRDEMSMERIRKWMEENPDGAKDVRRKNRSYVFFRVPPISASEEPKGAQGVSLTPGRSIAVDRGLHIYGTPFYIEADLPIENGQSTTQFRRLMVGQDTGSAIVGPARADLYFGAGHDAGQVAGRIRHPGRFAMLVPKDLELAGVAEHVPLPPERPEFVLTHPKTTPLPRPRPKVEASAQ
jgi:membrane-bound lytic murein transglycosylase A